MVLEPCNRPAISCGFLPCAPRKPHSAGKCLCFCRKVHSCAGKPFLLQLGLGGLRSMNGSSFLDERNHSSDSQQTKKRLSLFPQKETQKWPKAAFRPPKWLLVGLTKELLGQDFHFLLQTPRTPEGFQKRFRRGFWRGLWRVFEGFQKGFRKGPQLTPLKTLLKPFWSPSKTLQRPLQKPLLKPFRNPSGVRGVCSRKWKSWLLGHFRVSLQKPDKVFL